MVKKIMITLVIIGLMILPGCWDLQEIEDIGFMLAVAIDPLTEEEQEEELKKMEKEMGIKLDRDKVKKYKTTFQVAVPSGIAGMQEGGGVGNPFFNITTTDVTNFKMARNYAARRSRPLNFEHIKVMIINDELIREPETLEKLIDWYIRDHEMRRQMNVLIAKPPAHDALNHKLPLEIMPAISISDIRDNYPSANKMPPLTTIGEVAENIVAEHSFLIPRIIHDGEEGIKIAGAAVIFGREDVMVGWLGEEDVKGFNWIMGKAENGILQLPFEDKGMFVYENLMDTSKYSYERVNDQLNFHIEIRAEGIFGESWFHDVEISDENVIRQLEEEVEKRIEDQANQLIAKMQNEFFTDIFTLYREVRKNDYDLWQEIQDDWDGEGGRFSKANITVDAKVEIRHYMLNERLD